MNCWAITDKGIVRKVNEDAYFTLLDEDKNVAMLIVCDGMGGANAGNIASNIAVEVFTEKVKENIFEASTEYDIKQVVLDALECTNSAIFDKSLTCVDYQGMGTTVVAAVITEHSSVVINVGDSRTYQISENEITQITRDHSVVQDLVESGELTKEESYKHPNKNLITRALGTGPKIQGDIFYPELKEGDYLLLCSDGLSNIVSEREFFDEAKNSNSLQQCCERLVSIAISRGAPDNITIILFKK